MLIFDRSALFLRLRVLVLDLRTAEIDVRFSVGVDLSAGHFAADGPMTCA